MNQSTPKSRRARWDGLSKTWQGWLRPGEDAAPDDDALKELFAQPSLDLLPDAAITEDLAPLAFFPLEELRVNGRVSLVTLPRLPALRTLSCGAAALPDDLGARLPALERLTLVPLARHRKALSTLRVSEVEVETERGIDLAVLAALPGLKRLTLSDGPAKQVAALGRLTGLVALDLRYTKLTDLKPLASLHQLRELDLSCTRASDLAPLARLTKLERLSLFACKAVRSLEPLRGLKRLADLDLTATSVKEVAPLAALPALRTLNLGDTPVRDLQPLEGAKLTSLLVYGNALRDVQSVATMGALTSVDLRGTAVIDVRPLAALRRLTEVNLDETDVPWTLAAQLQTALSARNADAQVMHPGRPLAHFPGELDALCFGVLDALFKGDRMLKSSGAMYVTEQVVARPGDWNYAVTRMKFDARKALLTLWLDIYGKTSKLELYRPSDVRVSAEAFSIGAAEGVSLDGVLRHERGRSVFRI